jgi:hypothetical protein
MNCQELLFGERKRLMMDRRVGIKGTASKTIAILLAVILAVCGVALAPHKAYSVTTSDETIFDDVGGPAMGTIGLANFQPAWQAFFVGKTYKFKRSGKILVFSGGRYKQKSAKIISVRWYANKKLVSTKFSYKYPSKYVGKTASVKVKWRYAGSSKTKTSIYKSKAWTNDRFVRPDTDGRLQKSIKSKLSKGFATYKLVATGFGGGAYDTYTNDVMGVKVSPLYCKSDRGNSTNVKYNNYKGTKALKGAKVTYQWYYTIGHNSWGKIPGATGATYKVTEPYAGHAIGVIFTISKKGYTTSQGFANTLSA